MKITTKQTREFLKSLNAGLYTCIRYNKNTKEIFISNDYLARDVDGYIFIYGCWGTKNGYTLNDYLIKTMQRKINEYIQKRVLTKA